MNDGKELIDSEIERLKEDIIKSTSELIQIRSVEKDPKEGMPFGDGVHQALLYCQALCNSLGFETKNYDGYALEARFGDANEDVCVIGHLDVVPEGEGWSVDPYSGAIIDGKIYGRGAIDDKGPTIAALYGMYVVKKLVEEKKISIGKYLRFVFGTNEESGSNCLKYYFKKAKYPSIGFTPDADFPVIRGEMGIILFELKKKIDCDVFINGGDRLNMVADRCEFEGCFDVDIAKEYIEKELNEKAYITKTQSGYKIKTKGISAHGSLAFKGENAISYMFDILNRSYKDDNEFLRFIKFYTEHIAHDVFGKRLNIDFEDEESGRLIFNVGTIRTIDDEIILGVNIRYPVRSSYDDIVDNIKSIIKDFGIEYRLISHIEPLYFEKDHFLVKTLLDVYNKYTNQNHEPLVIGGGTYARNAKNILAFGPNMPGEEQLAHQKDEHISIEKLIDCAKIYANAIYRLAR